MKLKHTPWFSEGKPARDGVFKRRRPVYHHLTNQPAKSKIRYALFRDGVWFCEAKSPELAEKMRGIESAYQTNIEWRGLEEQA